jgi:Transposase DDE domain/Transposase domain (DUF772)
MHWKPPIGSAREERVAKKLRPSSKFYRFLWEIRGELFDGGFEERLIAAYQPRGQAPCPPAMLAMVMLLQRYEGISDADAVDAAENDRRWQLVLGVLGEEQSPFGQGSLVRFRMKMIEKDLDKALLDRTVELAKSTGKFGWKALRVALDSSPLAGAGRVEDTWNLIGRAMARVVSVVATALDLDEDQIIREARLKVLTADSVKAALDIDWDDEGAELEALRELLAQVERLEAWVKRRLGKAMDTPVEQALAMLRRVASQDIEPDPGGGGRRIRDGVAANRVVSLSDTEMRHGRKSKSKTFNGYKRHIAVANGVILATAVMPANAREHEATTTLLQAVEAHGEVACLDIDRGYLASDEIARLHGRGIEINSRPWLITNNGFYTKDAFRIDMRRRVVTCPAGTVANIGTEGKAAFSANDCGECPLRPSCTSAPRRSLSVHRNEELLIQLRKRKSTRRGRAELRKRVVVEHSLAQISGIQGRRARYVGARKNLLDLNRAAALANLYALARIRLAA